MTDLKSGEILVSIDGEFTGPIPVKYSLISLGAIAYTQEGKELSRFKVNLHELPGSIRDNATMKWWENFPKAWQWATANPVEPKAGMIQFKIWLNSLPGKPKLIGWPLGIDFTFVYWYYVNFLEEKPPFGLDGIDIKSYAMGRIGIETFAELSSVHMQKRLGLPERALTHEPVDDALQQAEWYFALRKLPKIRA